MLFAGCHANFTQAARKILGNYVSSDHFSVRRQIITGSETWLRHKIISASLRLVPSLDSGVRGQLLENQLKDEHGLLMIRLPNVTSSRRLALKFFAQFSVVGNLPGYIYAKLLSLITGQAFIMLHADNLSNDRRWSIK